MRDSQCYVGDQQKLEANIIETCACKDSDFECEYNHMRQDGVCVLIPGEKPLPDDDSCQDASGFWYERTAYRKIAHSTCEDGRGAKHICPGFAGHGAAFWWTLFALPFVFTAAVAWWWHRTRGFGGAIRLPGGDYSRPIGGGSSVVDTITSIPWFVVGIAGIAWEWVASRVSDMSQGSGARRGYRNVAVDEDAQVLRFQDDD
jgi:hypothetical protein